MEHLLPVMHLQPLRTVSYHCNPPPHLLCTVSLLFLYPPFIPLHIWPWHTRANIVILPTKTHQVTKAPPPPTPNTSDQRGWKFDLCNSFFSPCLSVQGETNNTEQCRNCHILPMGARLITASSIRKGKERIEEKSNTPTVQTKSKWEPKLWT